MFTAPTRNFIGITGILLTIIATVIFAALMSVPTFTMYREYWMNSMLLWLLGIVIIGWWSSRIENNLRKKISMVFAIIGQLLLWATFYYTHFSVDQSADYPYFVLPAVLICWILALAFTKIKRIGRYKGVERRSFSYPVTREILSKQKNCCAECKMNLTSKIIQYDHIDGDRSNNDISNCRALCSNCHSRKTRTV